jgi:hypothetical protein
MTAFLETCNISYVTQIISDPADLTDELIASLKKRFEEEAIDSPFCNMGDYDLNDFYQDLPQGWTLTEDGKLEPGQARITLAIVDYGVEREIDFDGSEDIEVVAVDLGGIHALSIVSDEDGENPFSGDFTTTATAQSLLFSICWPSDEIDNDECSLEDCTESLETWKSWLQEMKEM